MIDTFDKIKPFLVFDSDDDFYHLQILKRKKENPELGANSVVIKTYYVSSVEYLESKYPEIKNMCDFNNARAMINLNRRSFEKIAFHTLRKISEQIMNKDYFSVRKSYESCCGSFSNEKNKKWIIDIDERDQKLLNRIIGCILNLEPRSEKKDMKSLEEFSRNRIKTVLDTKNGYHIITSPFRLDKFNQEYPDMDVKKNNPTNLYIP